MHEIVPVLLLSNAGSVQLKFGRVVRTLYDVLQAKDTVLLADKAVELVKWAAGAKEGKITEPHVG